ncbi:retrovirus-related pol polyprotein from transposon TNT 1-94 [Tanacetum coccineum]
MCVSSCVFAGMSRSVLWVVATVVGQSIVCSYDSLNLEEIKSSTTNLDPSNVAEISFKYKPRTHIWTKDQPLDHVIGGPSKNVDDLITATYRILSVMYIILWFRNAQNSSGGEGLYEEEGLDFEEYLLLIARLEAVRMFIAFAAHRNITIFQMDVKRFLNWSLKKKVYVSQSLEVVY